MKVQDLWELYIGGKKPSEIESLYEGALIDNKKLAEAMVEIWTDYGTPFLSEV